MSSTSWWGAPAPKPAAQQAEVEADYRGPVISLWLLVDPFVALASLYAAAPAGFAMPLEDLFAVQYIGKVLEVEPRTGQRPARLVRVVNGAQLAALITGLPAARSQLDRFVQARLDAETQTEAYQAALSRYQAAQDEVRAARQLLQERLTAAARPFALAQFASVDRLAVEAPQLGAASTNAPAGGSAAAPARIPARAAVARRVAPRERLKAPPTADWSLDQYETEWNREHIILRRSGPERWEVISDAVGYVESNDDKTMQAAGESPNQAWRNFLRIRGRQASVSTPRQFRAGEVERAARGESG